VFFDFAVIGVRGVIRCSLRQMPLASCKSARTLTRFIFVINVQNNYGENREKLWAGDVGYHQYGSKQTALEQALESVSTGLSGE